jgi:hypothetical protein
VPPYYTFPVGFSVIEDATNNTYACVRTLADGGEDSILCQFEGGGVEAYDLALDPWNMENLAGRDTASVARQRRRLSALMSATGLE